MQRTASSSEDVEQEPTDDEEEEALDQVAHQVPRLQDMCRAFVYSNMRQKASRTLLSNLPEEAAVSVSNIKHLLMTSVDVRKAFSHGHNLDRHLEGNARTKRFAYMNASANYCSGRPTHSMLC